MTDQIPRFIGGVFARSGSKGLPNKNLRLLNGQSLVRRAVKQTLKVSHISKVLCSTDSSEIAAEAVASGAQVPWLRPTELSQDNSREWDAWCHLVQWLNKEGENPDYLVVVPTVAPLRTIDDLNESINLVVETGADVVMAISDADRNPWFNMVTFDPTDSGVRLVNEPVQRIYNRQSAPKVFDVTTVVFIIKCEYLLRTESIYEGDTRAIVLPRSHCIDIDTEDDFEYAEFLLKKRKEN